FLMGPIAQFLVIPFMTDGRGADTLGPWFGTGAERGLALVFVVTGLVGLLATLLALRSRSFHRLSRSFAGPGAGAEVGVDGVVDRADDGVAPDASPQRT